jgi:hypothetical protein
MHTKPAIAVWGAVVLMLVVMQGLAWTQPQDALEPLSTACFSTHASGSGNTLMRICLSNHGNLVRFESPVGVHHMGTDGIGDGYALCYNNGTHVFGYDAGFAEDGFDPPTISQPNGPNTFPLTITRDTFGMFRFKQTFDWDTTEKDVTITMTLTNISTVSWPNLILVRYFDGDIGGTASGDRWARSVDSVWGWEDNSGRGLMLTALSPSVTHVMMVEPYQSWFDYGHEDCGFVSTTTPTGPGNFVGRLRYAMGSFNPGQSKTVSVLYRRF